MGAAIILAGRRIAQGIPNILFKNRELASKKS